MATGLDEVFGYISDFWSLIREKRAFSLFWDSTVMQTSNLLLQLYNTDRSKGLFTVPSLFRTEWLTLRFDDTTRTSVPSDAPTGYPYAYLIDNKIALIRYMQNIVDPGGEYGAASVILRQDEDYIILFQDSIILFAQEPPQFMYSNTVFRDEEVLYNNFGLLVEYANPLIYSTDLYKAQLQGLFTALWLGGTLANIELGIHILFGFPFMAPGTVKSVTANADGSWSVVVDDTFGTNRDIEVPHLLGPPAVIPGTTYDRFTPLGVGIDVFDYIEDLGGILDLVESGSILLPQIFFSFAINLQPEAIEAAEDIWGTAFVTSTIPLIQDFVEKIKPEYTDWKLNQFKVFDDDEFTIADSAAEDLGRYIFRNITSTTLENYTNVLGQNVEFDDDTIALHDELTIVVIEPPPEYMGFSESFVITEDGATGWDSLDKASSMGLSSLINEPFNSGSWPGG